jgi:hypothetical protein
LRKGDSQARFPLGSFPPSLPFVNVYSGLVRGVCALPLVVAAIVHPGHNIMVRGREPFLIEPHITCERFREILAAVDCGVGRDVFRAGKAFQRPMSEGVELLNAIQDVYLDEGVTIA